MPFSPKAPVVYAYNSLVKFHLVEDDLEDILPAWVSVYDDVGMALYIYFALYRVEGVEVIFSEIAKALEVLHRSHPKFVDRGYMEQECFESMVEKFKDACTTDQERQFLEDKSKYWNKPILTKRIKELMEPCQGVVWNATQAKRIVNKIVKLRDHLTHEGKPEDTSGNYGREIMILSVQAELIFLINIGVMLEFSDEQKSSLIKQFRRRYNAIEL